MAFTGSSGPVHESFEEAANEVGLSPEIKDLFRREFSREELPALSKYLKEAKRDYSRKKLLAGIGLVLFAGLVTYFLVIFAWDPKTRSFKGLFWFVFLMPLILALVIVPVGLVLRKREKAESALPLVGERRLRHWAKVAIEIEEGKKANNMVRSMRIFKRDE